MKFRMILTVSAMLFCLLLFPANQASAQIPGNYVWLGEFVNADTSAKTLTVKVQVPGHSEYASKFKSGERVMLIWDMFRREPDAAASNPASNAAAQAAQTATMKTETDSVLYIDSYEAERSAKVDSGYILPGEFVSADASTATVKLHVQDSTMAAVKSVTPGKWIRVTSPKSQPSEVAAITTIVVADVPTRSALQ